MNGFQIKQIKRAMDAPEKLTDWEYDFISSISGLDEERELSEKQNKILNRIAEKVG
tara:strand:- start:684 stop:851 length:168 start_codon:yes stop_codon:yes gene_type:complete